MSKLPKAEVIEAARKYGYHGLFSKRDSLDEVMTWIEKHPQSDRPALVTAMMLGVNTIAYNIAEAELRGEK